MRKWILILMLLSMGMVVFNALQVNWETPLSVNSSVAVIGIMAALCAFLLLLLLLLSKKVSKKINR
ncbi:MAG: hypothetical protein VW058_03385 [Flavobacteriaceae bacterium]